MILAGDIERLGLFGTDILFGALDTDMAQQELGGAQVAGLLVDVGREGAAQRMQPIEGGIEPGPHQPALEQPPELAFAQMTVRPPHAPSGEQPAV